MIALVMIGLGARGAYWVIRDGKRGLASSSWPVASGTVRSGALETSAGAYGHTEWAADIEYAYSVAGVTYVGHNLNFPPRRGSRGSAVAVLQRYRVGNPVAVHYDPSNPQQSCLEPGLDLWFLFIIPTVSFLMLAAGTWLAVRSLRSHGA